MYDAGKIIPGFLIFLGLAGVPVWWNTATGATAGPPEIVKPAGEQRCVLEGAEMRREHMKLLVSWRETAVRDGDRMYTTVDGRRIRKSLTGTCLGCHTNKRDSCDRCHTYLNVHPVCWDCHVDPAERSGKGAAD